MSRYLGPRVKKMRRLQTSLPGLSTKSLHDLPPPKKKPKPRWKRSRYSIRLQEKQTMSLHYGLTERQLLKYVRIAGKTKGETSRVLLQLLEMRLDNILFRLGMATTLPGARQLVTHRHILVNGRIVDIPSYRCKPQDTIEARYDQSQSRALIQENLAARSKELEQDRRFFGYNYKQAKEKREELARKNVPDHLTLRESEYKGLINKIIDPYPGGQKPGGKKKGAFQSNLGVKINALRVVEYYSRQI